MKMKSKFLIYIVLAAVVLVGLFLILKPKQEVQGPQTSSEIQQAAVSPTPESSAKTFELIIQGKKLISGPSAIKVNQGDEITLKITSDEEEEFHIHAYDNFAELIPNQQATLTFVVDKSGRFPFELEKSKVELGAVEVAPK